MRVCECLNLRGVKMKKARVVLVELAMPDVSCTQMQRVLVREQDLASTVLALAARDEYAPRADRASENCACEGRGFKTREE